MENSNVYVDLLISNKVQNTNSIKAGEEMYVYSYQYEAYLFNNMMKDCLAGLNALTTTTITEAPTFAIDSTSQKCTMHLNVDKYGYK